MTSAFKYQRGDVVQMTGLPEWCAYTVQRLLVDTDSGARFYCLTPYGSNAAVLRNAKLIENLECFTKA